LLQLPSMFPISFQTSTTAIAQIFAMGAVGFVLVRKGILDAGGLKLLSFISVNIAFPLFIFYQITDHFYPDRNPSWWAFPLINVGLAILGLTITTILFWGRGKPVKDEVLATSSLHNAGYIPLLLAISLPLGAAAGKVYTAIILSIVGFDICLWTLGVWLITREQKPRVKLENLLNPPLISMAMAIIFVLAFGHGVLPEPLLKPIKIMGDSALALAMIVIGGNLGLTNFRTSHAYAVGWVVTIKLILIPLIVLVVLSRLSIDPIFAFVLMIQACMPTSITLSIIGRHFGTKNQDFVNQAIFWSHLLCLLTLPLYLCLFAKWVH
jgi:malate permease and related proteins